MRLAHLIDLRLSERSQHLRLRLELVDTPPVRLTLTLRIMRMDLSLALLKGPHLTLLLLEQLPHLTKLVHLLRKHPHVGPLISCRRQRLYHRHQLDYTPLVHLHLAAPLRLDLTKTLLRSAS